MFRLTGNHLRSRLLDFGRSPQNDMSSGFVSAGTDQEPAERDDEWLRVQHELEEERKRKADIGKQDGGKSLYDVLQQNKSESIQVRG